MKKLLCILIPVFCFSGLYLNEIMIDPDNENTGEFVEIFNHSSDTCNLINYYICDAGDTDRILIFPDSLLPPYSYGLILDPNYSGDYDALIPDTVPLFTISDSRFGQYGISNSSPKPFSILDSLLREIDMYITGSPVFPEEEHSIERVLISDSLWEESKDPGGTPGFINSKMPPPIDLGLSKMNLTYSDSLIHIIFTLKSSGLEKCRQTNISVLCGIPDIYCPAETSFTISDLNLSYGDSVDNSISISPPVCGKCFVQIKLSTISDNNPHNDSLQSQLFIPLNNNSLDISEFAFTTGDEVFCEFIEIQSFNQKIINIEDCIICDMTGSIIVKKTTLIHPDSVFVLSQSTLFHDNFPDVDNYSVLRSWRSLNNSGDEISFMSPDSNIIFHMSYRNNWTCPTDRIAERISFDLPADSCSSWYFSISGSPGQKNRTGIRLKKLKLFSSQDYFLSNSINELFFINTGLLPLASTACHLSLCNNSYEITLPASDPGDTLIARVSFPDCFLPGFHDGLITYDIFPPLPADSLLIYDAFDEPPLYLNELMFAPDEACSQAEFIELLCTDPPLDSRFWSLHINTKIIDLPGCLNSKYNIIASDDDKDNLYFNGTSHFIDGFPALPNSGCDISIIDPAGRVVDHVPFGQSHSPLKGLSLEKEYELQANRGDSLWHHSTSHGGMTPGRVNSITPVHNSDSVFTIWPRRFCSAENNCLEFRICSKTGLKYVRINVFNLMGHTIWSCEKNTFREPSAKIFWQPGSFAGNMLPRGIYCAVAETISCTNMKKTYKLSFIIY